MGRGGGGGGTGGGGGGRPGRERQGVAGEAAPGALAKDGVDARVVDGGPGIGEGPLTEVLEVRKRYVDQMEVTRAQALAERAAMTDKRLQNLSAYDDLPPVENANRRIIDGLVHVGPSGAPEVRPTLSNAQAMQRFKAMGLPEGDVAWNNIASSGDAAALVELLPEGSKFLGAGVEGAGFSLPSGRSIRIQHGGGQPLLQADVGKVGVYADWMAKYGNTWVEQKERVAMQGKFMGMGDVNAGVAQRYTAKGLQDNMYSNMLKERKAIKPVDDHMGNWGIDYQGRARVFDAGAYRRQVDPSVAAAIWENAPSQQVINPGRSRWQRAIRTAN